MPRGKQECEIHEIQLPEGPAGPPWQSCYGLQPNTFRFWDFSILNMCISNIFLNGYRTFPDPVFFTNTRCTVLRSWLALWCTECLMSARMKYTQKPLLRLSCTAAGATELCPTFSLPWNFWYAYTYWSFLAASGAQRFQSCGGLTGWNLSWTPSHLHWWIQVILEASCPDMVKESLCCREPTLLSKQLEGSSEVQHTFWSSDVLLQLLLSI